MTASKDKKFITNAFSQCLSKDVVNQIVAHPESFKLGGENREMTASELVALLNYYLTEMSDIIMEENGKEIFTRIGINSGEMIAGYMGSENKKNYTMMGNNVNLASRLEGVNKQYSTFGILMSEAAYYVNILERFFLKGSFPKEEDGVGVVYNNALNCFKLLSK